MRSTFLTENKTENAILVGVDTSNSHDWSIESSMSELASLARAAGVKIISQVTQKLEQPSPLLYLGRGKIEQMKELKESLNYGVVIFNDELTPRQQRNLEEALETKIIDRTALILDIFARRAKTSEGKLQVELAQHQYILPRLAGQWSHLERLGGGIGTRGPGESQLETDRRLIRLKIQKLKSKIEDVRRHRSLYRQKRKRVNIPVVALVGYTNSGKSTLLNALSNSSVFVANRLFSTLDPVTRKIMLPGKGEFLLTDTVGFIHKLPPTILAAFRATLEELHEADLLIHVLDITNRNAVEQNDTVEKILNDLGLKRKPSFTALNKIDILQSKADNWNLIMQNFKNEKVNNVFPISALKKIGLDILISEISKVLFREENRKNKLNTQSV